jgi:chromosome segregation ATPase
VDEVSAILIPGKYAVIADISEEWITPLDLEMEKLHGLVFRTARLDVEADQLRWEKAVYDMQIAQLKAEMKEAKAERKAKLQATIDQLNKARQKKIEQANQQLEQIKKEHDRKVQALKEKAANARGDTKAAIDARITELNQHHQQAVAKWKNAQAEKLENAADMLDEKAKKLKSEASTPQQSGKA